MPRIIAYTYDADVHCPDCTEHLFLIGRLVLARPCANDKNGLPMEMTDFEGNPIRPVFSTDEIPRQHCGDCGAPL